MNLSTILTILHKSRVRRLARTDPSGALSDERPYRNRNPVNGSTGVRFLGEERAGRIDPVKARSEDSCGAPH